jgi:hypothetical protein
MRARAKALRAEAKAKRDEAKDLESRADVADAYAARDAARARSHEAALEVAATMARPVWRTPELTGADVLVVKRVGGGDIVVGHALHDRDDKAYKTGHGWTAGFAYSIAQGHGPRLDVAATLQAWRAWCEERRARRATPEAQAFDALLAPRRLP